MNEASEDGAERVCRNCAFFRADGQYTFRSVPDPTGKNDFWERVPTGWCHRQPLRMWVNEDHWCGEFKVDA